MKQVLLRPKSLSTNPRMTVITQEFAFVMMQQNLQIGHYLRSLGGLFYLITDIVHTLDTTYYLVKESSIDGWIDKPDKHFTE